MIKYKLPFFTSLVASDESQKYNSWRRYSSEIYNVSDGIAFPETKTIFLETVQKFGKTTYAIYNIIKKAQKYNKKFVLINGDIEMDNNDELWNAAVEASNHGIVMGHRFNYEVNRNQASINLGGIDFFILNDKISIPEDDNFCMGLCGWDWWIPYLSIQQEIPVYRIDCPFLYHKEHPKQWNRESLVHICEYMQNMTGEVQDRIFKEKITDKTIPICP